MTFTMPPDADKRAAALDAFHQMRAQLKALNLQGDGNLMVGDYGRGDPEICAASGVAIWKDDEVVEDLETGEVFLRSALGLPQRPDVVEEAA